MSEYKCKGCQWYNKPYWSIINPCDNCHKEEINVEIITRWQDPIIEELKDQLQQKENIIKEVREYIKEWRESDGSGSYGTYELLEILEKVNKHDD